MEAKLIEAPAQTVDDFVDAQNLHKQFAATENRYQKLYKELKALVAAADPEGKGEFTVTGARYTVKISACEMERTVDVKAVRTKLGLRTLLKCCTVTIRALEDWMVKPDLASVLVVTQTGSRSYVAVPIPETVDTQGA